MLSGQVPLQYFYAELTSENTGNVHPADVNRHSAKRAAINIDMLIINTCCNAKHPCPGGDVICRTDNCFDMKASLTVIKPAISIRRSIPGAPCITDFPCSRPATVLALRQTCQYGRWKSNNNEDTRIVWGNYACFPSDAPSVAVCPARTQVTGCGYSLTSFWGGTNAPDSFAPVADGTACTLSVGKAPQACFKVWAACR